MGRKYRWGILAPGKMSAKFTAGLKLLDNAVCHAVGSRSFERAEEFASAYGFRKAYGSYEELASDRDVDVVYIASPHSHHYEHTMLCLRNNKHVICEKAFAMNSTEAETMVREASSRGLFLMEALWPPFQPLYKKAKEVLDSGTAGNLVHLNARFSFQPPFDRRDRKFDLSLGGSSLLDIGIYPVIDALTFMGIPGGIDARASFGRSGTEDSVSIIFSYSDGRMANLYSSYRTSAGIGCDLLCEKGNILFSRKRDMSQNLVIAMHDGKVNESSLIPDGMGYHFEAIEVMKCLDAGMTESAVVPLKFSLDLIRTLDRIREVAGIRFGSDSPVV